MNEPKLLTPREWQDYELIDSGGFEKLERFGDWIVARPEPQAIWDKSLSEKEWENMADAMFGKKTFDQNNIDKNRKSGSQFRRDKNDTPSSTLFADEKGVWAKKQSMPDQWWINYQYREMKIRMRLGMTSFKHVGIFPEQAENWKFIYDTVTGYKNNLGRTPKVLNLFAYTGGATLAARSAGAEVTHVDSVKQVVSWAKENMEASGLDGIRWIVDDAMKFVRREVKRGKKYDGIILDPPAYGRGPDGEKWILEQNINELLNLCSQLTEQHDSFLVFNLYSMGLSGLLAKTLVNNIFANKKQIQGKNNNPHYEEQFGELYFNDRYGKSLPLGVYYRFKK